MADATVDCWGRSISYLGDRFYTVQSGRPPTATAYGVTDAVGLFGGEIFTCARLRDGGAKCWGVNGSGELGAPVYLSWVVRPVTVSGLS
jgi:hypothetical protein